MKRKYTKRPKAAVAAPASAIVPADAAASAIVPADVAASAIAPAAASAAAAPSAAVVKRRYCSKMAQRGDDTPVEPPAKKAAPDGRNSKGNNVIKNGKPSFSHERSRRHFLVRAGSLAIKSTQFKYDSDAAMHVAEKEAREHLAILMTRLAGCEVIE